MFASIDRSPRRRNRAVTLIEAVLYISIALALIVGGLVFYQQASTAAKTSTMVRQLSAILAEARVLVKGQPISGECTSSACQLSPMLIAAGAVPPDMVKDSRTLSNPFGGTIFIWAQRDRADEIGFSLSNIPQAVCTRLLTSTSASQADNLGGFDTPTTTTSIVSSGLIRSYAYGPNTQGDNPPVFFNMNVTQAGWMCKYGTDGYTDKNTEPTSTPISGNVTVGMHFRI
jgi:hypothetical protein